MYAQRWGIGTGYSIHNKIRPQTTSCDPTARLFCFLYELVCNVWVLINTLLLVENVHRPMRVMTFGRLWNFIYFEICVEGDRHTLLMSSHWHIPDY